MKTTGEKKREISAGTERLRKFGCVEGGTDHKGEAGLILPKTDLRTYLQ